MKHSDVDWVTAGKRAFATRLRRAGLSDWHAQEAAGLLTLKAGERERILDFLVQNHTFTPIRLLSLPGSRFVVERAIADLHFGRDNARFVCFERDADFIRLARSVIRKHIPGRGFRSMEIDGIPVIQTDKTTLYNTSVGDLADIKLDDPLTAVWFDGMGLLTTEDVRRMALGLRRNIAKGTSVPAAFTFQLGRDADKHYEYCPGNSMSKRVRKLVSILNQAKLDFDVQEFWTYKSDTTGPLPMLNVCGILRRKVTQQGVGKGGFGPLNAWTLIEAEDFERLRAELSNQNLSNFLGLSENIVRRYGPDKAPDLTTQAEIRRLVKVCQQVNLSG